MGTVAALKKIRNTLIITAAVCWLLSFGCAYFGDSEKGILNTWFSAMAFFGFISGFGTTIGAIATHIIMIDAMRAK